MGDLGSECSDASSWTGFDFSEVGLISYVLDFLFCHVLLQL